MKKIIALSLIGALLLAIPAHAVTRWSYNRTSFLPISILAEWVAGGVGWSLRSTVAYSKNAQGCLVVIVTQWAGPIQTGQTVTEFPCR